MYSLTINFKTLEELNQYINQDKTTARITTPEPVKYDVEVPPVIEVKEPPKKRGRKPAEEVKPEPEFEQVEFPFVAVQKPPFDRDAAIAKAQKLVAELKGTGIADDKLMPAIHEVYAQAQCPIHLKISQLSDDQLSEFIPMFEQKVKAIVANTKSQPTSASFI